MIGFNSDPSLIIIIVYPCLYNPVKRLSFALYSVCVGLLAIIANMCTTHSRYSSSFAVILSCVLLRHLTSQLGVWLWGFSYSPRALMKSSTDVG